MKCAICNKQVKTTFLGKLVGTYWRNSKGKRTPICNECQKNLSKEEIKEKVG